VTSPLNLSHRDQDLTLLLSDDVTQMLLVLRAFMALHLIVESLKDPLELLLHLCSEVFKPVFDFRLDSYRLILKIDHFVIIGEDFLNRVSLLLSFASVV